MPMDTGQWVVVRKLTGRECETAERAGMLGMVNGKSSRGWAGRLARIFAGEGVTSDIVEQLQSDPMCGFDRSEVVRGGLVSWSYNRPLTDIADLDDEALDFIAIEVMRLTKPGRFQSADEREAARKND